MIRHHHSLFREGTDSGFLGAIAVAVWFLLLDVIRGVPLLTPSVLGQVLLFGEAQPVMDHAVFGAVLAYTVVHFAAFVAFGIGMTELFHLAAKEPMFIFAVLIVFVVFEFFFFAITFTFFTGTEGLFPWWSVLVANTLASVVMGVYLWKKHPSIKRALQRQSLGDVAGPPHPREG